MTIEFFGDAPTKLDRAPMIATIKGTQLPAFLVTLYATGSGEAVKVDDLLEVRTDGAWTNYFWDNARKVWLDVLGAVTAIELRIPLQADTTINNYSVAAGPTIRYAYTPDNRSVFGRLNVDRFDWFNLDGSAYGGDPNALDFIGDAGAGSDQQSHQVFERYLPIDAETNTWVRVYRVVTLAPNGSILRSRVMDKFSTLIVNAVFEKPTALTVTEVYQVTAPAKTSADFDVAAFLGTRELVELTLNINCPVTRLLGKSTAILELGETSQILTSGRKTYNDKGDSGRVIGTFPIVTLENGATLDCDLRFLLPPIVLDVFPVPPTDPDAATPVNDLEGELASASGASGG
jgi:hypothetical protein